MENIKIGKKLLLIVATALVGLTVLLGVGLTSLHTTLMDDRRAQIYSLVEAAHGIATDYAARAQAGVLSEDEAKARTTDAIGAMRYRDGAEYVFIIRTDDGHMVSHPNASLVGTDVSGLKDPEGTLFVREMMDAVNADGEGYVEYMWPRDGSDQPIEKLSFAKGVPQWNWMIATGIYLDDVSTAFWLKAASFAVVAALMVVAMLGLSSFISHSITAPVRGLTGVMKP